MFTWKFTIFEWIISNLSSIQGLPGQVKDG